MASVRKRRGLQKRTSTAACVPALGVWEGGTGGEPAGERHRRWALTAPMVHTRQGEHVRVGTIGTR